MRILNVFLLLLVFAVAVGLYDVKYRAEATDRNVRILKSDIREEEEAVRVLRAEWSYLNTPADLQKYAERHMANLKPLRPDQIGTFDELPFKEVPGDLLRQPEDPLQGGFAGMPSGGIY